MKRMSMLLALFTASFATVGCDRDIAEVQTPSGQEVEVERDLTTGAVETEVED